MSNLFFSISMVITYVLLNATSALIIKRQLSLIGQVNWHSLSEFIKFFITVFTSPIILACFAAIFISAVAWMAALSRMNISIAYPIATALNFLIVVASSLLFLGESLALHKLLGIILLLVSMALLSF